MSVNEYAKPILDGVYRLRNSGGQDASYAFQVPPSRKLVDYYQVIKRPMALDMIRKNLKQKKYEQFKEFVVDLAQITYNARLYNPRESFIYTDALVLDKHIKDSLAKLRKQAKLDPDQLEYPDLGPLPHYSDVESLSSSESEMSQGEEENTRRRPVRRSVLMARNKHLRGDSDDEGAPRKRGRPPTVDKPHEHRIKAVLRAIRRERDSDTGRAVHTEFDRLPDQKLIPQYYKEITNPIALDIIRKKIKRREYNTLDEFMSDIALMVSNAKQFNPPGSSIYEDAVAIDKVAQLTYAEESKNPDSLYVTETDSKAVRVPLDQVQHRGEIYQVGDWVHIENPNDPAKPIIGQVFRLWQQDGKTWVNACWYYRPEQTVHQYTKCFYENEVVKSGQYRDHTIDQILEKCFVMFITKYQRGRPTGIGNRSVYCCESRYNESDRQLTKIRTWKACIPDEVRSGDYPMDMFGQTQTLRRLASPIKHLLPADAKDTDPIPQPKIGSPNAPPIVGAVYKRPIDPNDPPETPTPDTSVTRKPSPAAPTIPTSMASTPTSLGTPNANSMGNDRRFPYANNGSSVLSSRTVPGTSYGASQLSAAPTSIPTAFSLPSPFVAGLREDQMSGVARGKDGQPLWFPACPIWVSHRYQSDPIPHSLKFTVEGKTPSGLVVARGLGHSAKYLAWKAKQDSVK